MSGAVGIPVVHDGEDVKVFPRLIELMKRQGVSDDILLVGGGVIPDEDVAELARMGVAEIVGQETPTDDVVATVRRLVEQRRGTRV